MRWKSLYQEGKDTLKIALPLALTNLLQMSTATVDIVMSGWQDDGGLTQASVSLGAGLWQMCMLALIGVCLPLSPLFAHAHALGESSLMQRKFASAFWLALALSVFALLVAYFSPAIMPLIGIKTHIIPKASQYLHIMAFSLPIVALFLVPRLFNEGLGNTKILLYISILSIPFNIVGNYIFLNGLLGLPKMGAQGIAIASLIALSFSSIIMYYYLTHSRKILPFKLFAQLRTPSWPLMRELLGLGIPVSFSLLMEGGLFTGVVLIAGKMGVDIAAANQIALNYASLIFMLPLGISMALAARIGRASAQKDPLRIRQIALSGILISTVVMLGSVLAILGFARQIAGFYSTDNRIIELASSLLFYAALFQLPDGIQVCAASCLRGLRDTKMASLYAFLGYWVISIPLAYYLSIHTALAVEGLWIALCLGLSITAILNSWRFLRITRRAPSFN